MSRLYEWSFQLNHSFQKDSTGQNSQSYNGRAIWNRIPENLKKSENLNTFKQVETLLFE